MDLKELVNKINESLNESGEPVAFGTTFMTRGGNIEAKMVTIEKDPETDMPTVDEVYFDGRPVAKLFYRHGTDSDFATAIGKIEVLDKFGFNDLVGLCLYNELDKEIVESVNEANSYTDDMLDKINIANKTINSDLEFNVQVKEVNGGVAFNANGTGVQYHPYKPVDHEASKEELADVVNRCAEVIENKINELEDEIIGIFNERGFRK